ncbi:FecR domain-containing protein [Thalassotalea marina]|uniref:Sensor n=1 Tax=Thalassotalea marina TaxID=1673741 RepID=A0A919BHD1_9GAMM|nr:FecR domain-containing protein [Thalassotalea marina]GHF88072.1 sensor [Thalassotalea marina]
MQLNTHKDSAVIEQVADWLVLLQSDDVTELDIKRLNLWLAQNKAHRDAWQQANHFLTNIEHLPCSVNSQTMLTLNQQGRRRVVKLLSALFAIPTTGYLTVQSGLHHSVIADHQTAIGESKTVTLNDGSVIELNTQTKITTTFNQVQRSLNLLAGEIFITTGKKHGELLPPFRVITDHGVIEALGTAFNVKATEQGIEVEVSEHAVLVTTEHAELMVKAGESLKFSRHMLQPKVNKLQLSAMWRKGLFVAASLPLFQLIEELGRYHHRLVNIDNSIRNIQVSGTFDIHDFTGTLALLCESLAIDVVYRTKWWLAIVPKAPHS